MNATITDIRASEGANTKRAAAHALIRAEGFSEKLDRLIALLADYRAAFEEVISLSTEHHDRVPASIVDGLAKKARGGLSVQLRAAA